MNPYETRRPHDAIYPIGDPPTTPEQEQDELDTLAQGEPGHDPILCTGEGPPLTVAERERQYLRGILTQEELVEEVGICAAIPIMARAEGA